MQLALVDQGLAEDPQNAELHTLRAELEQMLQLLNESMAELQAASAPPPPKQSSIASGKKAAAAAAADASPVAEKWSRENHPAFKKAAVEPAPEEPSKQDAAPVVYQVNDNVLARWMSGDKGFYPARITSVTGSKTAPVYTVRFKSYDTVETVRGKDIKPVATDAPAAAATGQKRKAEGNGIVLSAGQELYPHAVEQKKMEAEGKSKAEKYDELGRPKFKKIKAKKELEAGKNKWQEFTAKGKVGKVAKKESMFRTPEGPGGRGELPLFLFWWNTEYFEGTFANLGILHSGLYRLWPGHAQGPHEEPPCVPAQRRCGLMMADLRFFLPFRQDDAFIHIDTASGSEFHGVSRHSNRSPLSTATGGTNSHDTAFCSTLIGMGRRVWTTLPFYLLASHSLGKKDRG